MKVFIAYFVAFIALLGCWEFICWLARKLMPLVNWLGTSITNVYDWLQAHPPLMVVALCAVFALVATFFHRRAKWH